MSGCAPTARAGRVSPRRASYLSLLRQRKVTERKASRIRRPYGHAALLGAAGVWLNSLRSDNASPDPSAPALLASSLRRENEYPILCTTHNERKHGVTFDEASTEFGDALSATGRDLEHSISEPRFVTLGISSYGRPAVQL